MANIGHQICRTCGLVGEIQNYLGIGNELGRKLHFTWGLTRDVLPSKMQFSLVHGLSSYPNRESRAIERSEAGGSTDYPTQI